MFKTTTLSRLLFVVLMSVNTLNSAMGAGAMDSTAEATDSTAEATDSTADVPESNIDDIVESLKYQDGTIIVKDPSSSKDLASISTGDALRYLNSQDTKTVLETLWGNPPDAPSLGMIVPKGFTPFGGDGHYFAIDITYSEDGYVDDKDAKDINFDSLLEEMKRDAKRYNSERVEQGYSPVELIGWAQAPFYDSESKKLYWAKELKFGDSDIHTLNYNIRILGRKGYLNLNIIAGMDDLEFVNEQLKTILDAVEFKPEFHYSSYDPSIDKLASYGIGALVAGKVLSKAGFFVVLMKFWKLIAAGIAALFIGLKKKFLGHKD